MTAEERNNPTQTRPLNLSPWLAVLGGLILYGLTLNHWVSLKSLTLMSQVTGWDWHPYSFPWRLETASPLFILLTFPLRILPAGWLPPALNIFTALCAALTLGLLARSVSIFPHDRTREQRQRELAPNALLANRAAFLPAVFAVALMATHLLFWQHAVVATGEMVNILVFAFIINCIAEFRISHKDSWLFMSALAYGLGTTNNWALMGYFPIYLFAIFRSRGLIGFFNVRFLLKMLLCGLAGLTLYLLVPFMGASSSGEGGFAYLFHRELGTQWYDLRLLPSMIWLLAALPTVVPLIFACIRWPSFEGELSPTGFWLSRSMFYFLHIAFLALVLATFFDFKYSPSVRMREVSSVTDFMTFYYAAALCAGYLAGYMLLVFSPSRAPVWEQRRHQIQLGINRVMYGLTWAISLGVPAALFWQSYPHISAGNQHLLQQYADQTLESLPQKPAILLSDDPARLYMVEADCQRLGVKNNHILIDTACFPHREYLSYLIAKYPAVAAEMTTALTTNMALLPDVIGSGYLVRFIYRSTQNIPVYYLHPSFGYYFEALHLKPHGLVYELVPSTNRIVAPPLPPESEISQIETFWEKLENGTLKPLPELARENMDADAVCSDYGVALDYWGTELQRAATEMQKPAYLKDAHRQFAQALRLNTNNFIAEINLQYNERLQKGDHRPIDSTDTFGKALEMYGLAPLLRRDGPPDEPNLDTEVGEALSKGGNLGQGAALFERRLQLLPGDSSAKLDMAKTYVDMRLPEKAMEIVRDLRKTSKISAWQLTRCEALAYLASGDYPTAEKVLLRAIQEDPRDENRVATLGDYYRVRGMTFSRERKYSEAGVFYTNALTNIESSMRLLQADTRDSAPDFDLGDALMKKAQVLIALNRHAEAISTLGQVLLLQPGNYNAVVNRALSEIQLKQFKSAESDFRSLTKLLPDQPYLLEYGLADVASAQTNKVQEIYHLKRCIRFAPDSSSEYQTATNRLAKLQTK
ncbi:MAG TPA: tetratricopeptide repeat protein [Verrucomicrobiae bacterium]|jgi:tetratricopeptide (TPR) repeat protein